MKNYMDGQPLPILGVVTIGHSVYVDSLHARELSPDKLEGFIRHELALAASSEISNKLIRTLHDDPRFDRMTVSVDYGFIPQIDVYKKMLRDSLNDAYLQGVRDAITKGVVNE